MNDGNRWRAGLLLACALSPSCKDKGAARPGRPPPLVTVAKVVARDVPVEVRAPVDLRPLWQADVGSKTLGYLDAVLVDRGDVVKRGQLLALVRPSDLPDQLQAARGALAQAQASAALAQQSRERAASLAPSGVVSQQELQQSEAAVATSSAAEAAARSQIAAIGVRLRETRIDAPLDGVVSQRRLDPGALVGPATGPIVTVVRTDVLRVYITLGEREAVLVRIGQPAYVTVDALPERRFDGKVVRLAPAFDPGTRTLDAEVHLDNPEGLLRPGMYGRGAIVTAVHRGVPVVPDAAVQINEQGRSVFVVSGEVARRRKIETGVDEGRYLEVRAGLGAGEEIVTAGADGLADGAKVRVARDIDPYSGLPLSPDGGQRDGG